MKLKGWVMEWHRFNLSRCAGGQWRWARGDRSWGLRFRVWFPGSYAGMPRGVRFPADRYLPLWPARLDYQAIAARSGWCKGSDTGLMIYHGPTWGSWKAACSWAGTDNQPNGEFDLPTIYTSWKDCCEGEDLL